MRKPTGQLKFAYDTIARQQIKIDKLESQLAGAKDSIQRRQDWLYKAKNRVNIDDSYSFDLIWKRVCDEFDKGNINFDDLKY